LEKANDNDGNVCVCVEVILYSCGILCIYHFGQYSHDEQK